ncbi:MAG: hypothetical protein LUD72_11405 [Bacteroidales bacterium]|nr:hypothetical protein [Bacteroidales bacterium]
MTTDELLESAQTLMDKPETGEEYLNINWETRVITLPSGLTNIGVYNDKDTNRLYFRCPIEYGEFRIADFGIHVNYQNTGKSNTKYDGDVYFCDDVESDGDYLTFSWLVGRHAYLEQGTTAFIVCCKVVDGDDNIVNELNTTVATLSVLEGLEVDVAPPEDYPDYIEEILKRCEAAETAAEDAEESAASAKSAAEDAQTAAESAAASAKAAEESAAAAAETAEEALEKAQEVEESAITGVSVNGDPLDVIEHVVDVIVPTKTSELENDSDYATKEEIAAQIAEIVAGAPESLDTLKEIADWIEGHAKDAAEMNSQIKQNAEDIEALRDLVGELPASASSIVEYIEAVVPTKTSQLTNDSGYITDEALEDYATKEEVEAVEDAAITGINVNGTPAEINDHIADIEVSGGGGYSISYDEPDEALVFAAGAGITYDEPTQTLIF